MQRQLQGILMKCCIAGPCLHVALFQGLAGYGGQRIIHNQAEEAEEIAAEGRQLDLTGPSWTYWTCWICGLL